MAVFGAQNGADTRQSARCISQASITCALYTSTHDDLTTVNIMIKDGNLAAIIDWYSAGYFLAWYYAALEIRT
jgi:hypothetical protein